MSFFMDYVSWGKITNGWVPRHPTEAYFEAFRAAVAKWRNDQIKVTIQ